MHDKHQDVEMVKETDTIPIGCCVHNYKSCCQHMNPPHVVEIKALIRKNMHTEKLVNQWIKAKNSFRGKGGKQKLESTNQIGY